MKGAVIQKQISDNRGVALIITIMMMTLLATVVFELNRRVHVGIDDAAVFKTRVKLSSMAASGIHMGMGVLIQDKNETEIDSIQEPWADADYLAEVARAFPFDAGEVRLTIFDLLGRIQVNALVQYPEGKQFNETQKVMWYRLLETLSIGESEDESIKPLSIINAVKDWLDYGDDDAITGLDGAESEYYQELDPPYACRNGPLVDVSELMLVKGLSPEIFDVVRALYGVSDWVTTAGMTQVEQGTGYTFPGAININTAPLFVVTALLPLEDNHLAVDICEFREEMTNDTYVNDLTSPTWYKSVHGAGELTIDAGLITTSSDIYQITATAALNNMTVTHDAVVKREKDEASGKWRCRVLKWQS